MAKVVTITNPVTGQPAQVDQLDHTAQQIDDAVAAAHWSHRNLLDNAYFANPDAIIDQRGGYVVPPGTAYYSDTGLTTQAGAVSAYTKAAKVNSTYGTITVSGTTYYVEWSAAVRGYTGAGYGIDRWCTVSNEIVVLINKDSVTLENTGTSSFIWWKQPLENVKNLLGKTVTVSALIKKSRADMPLRFGLSGIDNATPTNTTDIQLVSYTAIVNDTAVNNSFFDFVTDVGGISGDSLTIYAAKLELGTVQTLAHQDENGNWVLNDQPPDKALELVKCQRYQVIIPAGGCFVGRTASSTLAVFEIPTPVSMRIAPSISSAGKTFEAVCNGQAYTLTVSGIDVLLPQGVRLVCAGTNLPVNQPIVLYDLYGILDANL